MPVRQKAHFSGHPACVEMQIVRRRVLGNVDALDRGAVVELEQELHGAVRRVLALGDVGPAQREALGEPRAQWLAEIRHPGEAPGAFVVEPGVDLPGPEARLTQFFEEGLESAKLETEEVRRHPRDDSAPSTIPRA